ncbi:Uncharacterized protein HZ326_14747 [Fusarium oxysporum f. sp. albedinis]|nr:Uncharacterized protein HZ326_14747 [Fusarium oxysporum f. sp. albedinis]
MISLMTEVGHGPNTDSSRALTGVTPSPRYNHLTADSDSGSPAYCFSAARIRVDDSVIAHHIKSATVHSLKSCS